MKQRGKQTGIFQQKIRTIISQSALIISKIWLRYHVTNNECEILTLTRR